MSEKEPFNVIAKLFFWVCVMGAVVIYVIRAFHPEQPLHHELNDAGGVLIGAAIISLILS